MLRLLIWTKTRGLRKRGAGLPRSKEFHQQHARFRILGGTAGINGNSPQIENLRCIGVVIWEGFGEDNWEDCLRIKARFNFEV